MQIGNNRPNGLQPRDTKPLLDPDLTRSNREGLESTTRVSSDKVQEAAQKHSEVKSPEMRNKTTDTFERSKPQDDPGMDVAERIKNARSQQMAERVGNARSQQMAERVGDARSQQMAERVGDARSQQTAERVGDARAQHAGEETKVRKGREHDDGSMKAKAVRIEGARSQSADASAMATRIKNARTDYRASQVDLPGIGGRPETSAARSTRVDSLRQAHDAGSLNTPERASQAASRLLGGE